MKRAAFLVVLLCASGCTAKDEPALQVVHASAVEHGRAIFSDRTASPSTLNAFSCATCHVDVVAPGDLRMLPGAPLSGVTTRTSFWAGQEDDLLRAIGDCRYAFMQARDAWTPDDEEAKATWAYLASLGDGDGKAAPFTVVRSVVDLAAGDSKRGEEVFARACRSCHGDAHTGAGRIAPQIPALPDDTVAAHSQYSATDRRVTFIEKVRHGGFLGYAGTMPPFSAEVMSDEDLAGLLAFFSLYP